MKFNTKPLAAAGLLLASTFLIACGETTGVLSNVYVVNYKQDIGAIQVNTTIDLDQYLTLVRQDKSEDSNFTVTTEDESVIIDGHKVTPTKIGNFTIHLVDERVNFDRKITIDSRSADNMTVIDFFDNLSETPNHYQVDLFDFNSSGTALQYAGMSYVHTPNYSAAFNLTNPGATDSNGEANSFILAMLTNEIGEMNGFQGYFDTKGNPTFLPGALAFYSYYYINMDIPVDGYSFTSEFTTGADGEETETITADTTFTENLLLYGCSASFPDTIEATNGNTYSKEGAGTLLLGMDDTDLDDTVDTLYLWPYFIGANVEDSTDVQMITYYPLKIHSVGTAKVDKLEQAINDPAYYPKKIESPEITTAFENVAKTNNYTVTMELAPSGTSTSFYEYLFGDTTPVKEVNKITQDGILLTETEGDETRVGGYFNRDGKAYKIQTKTNEETKALETTTEEIDGVTDFWTVDSVDSLTAKAVTSASVDSTIWRTKKEDTANKTITYTGMVGDDDGAGNKDNGLFQELFDQLGLLAFGSDGTRFGTLLTQSNLLLVDAAATTSSDYTSFAINTETNEITVKAQLYFPVEGYSGSYIDCAYTISDIGTTTNDFSSFKAKGKE